MRTSQIHHLIGVHLIKKRDEFNHLTNLMIRTREIWNTCTKDLKRSIGLLPLKICIQINKAS
jgi:hypothetical protein